LPLLAPILGGWLEVAFGWRSVFGFLATFGFLLLAVSVEASGELAGCQAVASALRDFEELPDDGN
jgi:MFS family permease